MLKKIFLASLIPFMPVASYTTNIVKLVIYCYTEPYQIPQNPQNISPFEISIKTAPQKQNSILDLSSEKSLRRLTVLLGQLHQEQKNNLFKSL